MFPNAAGVVPDRRDDHVGRRPPAEGGQVSLRFTEVRQSGARALPSGAVSGFRLDVVASPLPDTP